MRLRELKLLRLPGIERPFAIRPGGGVNLVLGPNGSGKSSLARAFQRLLWPDAGSARPSEVHAALEIDGAAYTAQRQNDEAVVWMRDGAESPAPALPPAHLAACYRLGLLDLNRPAAGQDDEALGREILTRMAGGFDLTGLTEQLFPYSQRAGLKERGDLTRARGRTQEIQRRQWALARDRDRLGELEAEVEAAQLARTRQAQFERLRNIRRLRTELDAHEAGLAELPAALANLRPDDPDLLETLLERRRQSAAQIEALERTLAESRDRSGQIAFPDGVDADLLIGELDARLGDLRSRHEEAERLERELGAGSDPEENGGPEIDADLYQRFRRLHIERDRADAQVGYLRALHEANARKRPPSRLPGWLVTLSGILVLINATLGPTGLHPALAVVGGLLLVAGLLLVTRLFPFSRPRQEDPEQELQAAEAGLRSLDQELQQLAGEHGLELDAPELLYTLKELSLAQDRRAELQRRQADLRTARQARDEALGRINRDLERLGSGACIDPAGASARVGVLKDRRTELRTLAEGERRDRDALDTARRQAENSERDLQSLLQRLGLAQADDPSSGLAALTLQQPRWQSLYTDSETARAELRRLESEAQAEPDLIDAPSAAAWTDEQLAAQARKESERAALLDELNQEIGSIRGRVGAARAGTELTAALAEEEACRRNLEAARDGARETALGRWLLNEVREQNETQAQPAVWKAAVEHFRRFTRNEWELLIQESDAGGRFAARSVGPGTVHTLDQLSDGTRAQLLLAVRLGFLQEQESDARPPLFVDEALTASDPARFAAIAAALAELSGAQGRQVFYLTADPADVDRFGAVLAERGLPPAERIDLAEVRSLAAAADPSAVTRRSLDPVPSPAGLDLAAYVRRLAVPRIDPWRPASAAHLAYLTRDEGGELETLRGLLEAGADTVGRWQKARTDLETAGVALPGGNEELAWRALVLEAFLDGWRIGRARPLTREDLEDSGAVSERMLPNVWSECLNQECDGARLIAAVRDRAVARFGTRQIDELEIYLEGERLLASGETLPREQLVLHAIQFLGDRLGEGRTGEVRYWIGRLLGAVQPHGEESAEESGSR